MIVREDVLLSDVLWYRIGGRARFLIDAGSSADVLDAVAFVRRHGVERVHFLGQGANLLFPDEYFDGAIIRLIDGAEPADSVHTRGHGNQGVRREPENGAVGEHTLIRSYAGETLDNLIHRAFASGLVGLEWAGGLPGTVGAAVRGNVGAFGGEIKDSIHEVDVLDVGPDVHGIRTLSRGELNFGYRDSLLKRDRRLVALSATLELRRGQPAEVAAAREVYHANIRYRTERHPLDYPNTGSTFKNVAAPDEVGKVLAALPDLAPLVAHEWHGKVSMGNLNRRLGFSGFRIGNAMVSEKHCNFILNLGGARADDVTSIIAAIQRTFQETFGFSPEPEVEIVDHGQGDRMRTP